MSSGIISQKVPLMAIIDVNLTCDDQTMNDVFKVHFLILLWAIFVSAAINSASADKRVLMIGIDGAGGSYTQNANTPNLDALIAAGAGRYDFLNEGALVANPPESYGASGVNWSTILTGASAASHQVPDNGFGGNNLTNVPSFFHYLEQSYPSLFTASIVNWTPINTFIVDNQDVDLEVGDLTDAGVKNEAVSLLTTGDPDAIFLHFDQVDGAGHSFSWGSSQYIAAIQTVDGLIGEIMSALNARPGVISGNEDWLVLVSADHGGAAGSFSHFASQGTSNWHVPFIVSGPSVPDGLSLPQGTLRDLATTALWHLGVDPFGTTVEGKVVGIPFGSPNAIVGDVNQDGIVFGNGTGPAAADDVTAFVNGWMTRNHPSVYQSYTKGDLNLDRVTDLRDWIILNQLDPAMGQAVFAAFNRVPEANTLSLGMVALFGGFLRRTRLHSAAR